jgi:hypothetical protein
MTETPERPPENNPDIDAILKAPLPAAVLSGGAVRLPLIRVRSRLINDVITYFRVRADGSLEEQSDCVEIGPDDEAPKSEYQIFYIALKFSHRALAGIEEKWGNTEAWNEAITARTETTIIETLAIALNKAVEEITLGLIDGASQRYAALVYAAWMTAAGMDPQMARTFLKRLEEVTSEQNESIETKMGEAMTQMKAAMSDDSLGNNGSQPGSSANAQLANSGN